MGAVLLSVFLEETFSAIDILLHPPLSFLLTCRTTLTLSFSMICTRCSVMADAGEVRKKRSFRKFSYRGIDLDQLLDLSSEQVCLCWWKRSVLGWRGLGRQLQSRRTTGLSMCHERPLLLKRCGANCCSLAGVLLPFRLWSRSDAALTLLFF